MNKPLVCSHQECVYSVPIFGDLQKEQMAEVKKVIQDISFEKGETVYHAEDISDALYIVNKGSVKIYRLSETGKEQLIRILSPGEFTGELALFHDVTSKHGAYAEALMSSSICKINRKDLQELLLSYPSISLKILTEFSNRLENSEKQATSFATEKTDTRIALFLAELVEQSNSDGDSFVVRIPMSRKDLASYLGTTPETISRQFKNFEDQGLIKQEENNKISILKLDDLLLV